MMDSLMDISLEQQIISRAYRMGAKQSVKVEFIYSGMTTSYLNAVEVCVFLSNSMNLYACYT